MAQRYRRHACRRAALAAQNGWRGSMAAGTAAAAGA
jgi:hypothetical protein